MTALGGDAFTPAQGERFDVIVTSRRTFPVVVSSQESARRHHASRCRGAALCFRVRAGRGKVTLQSMESSPGSDLAPAVLKVLA